MIRPAGRAHDPGVCESIVPSYGSVDGGTAISVKFVDCGGVIDRVEVGGQVTRASVHPAPPPRAGLLAITIVGGDEHRGPARPGQAGLRCSRYAPHSGQPFPLTHQCARAAARAAVRRALRPHQHWSPVPVQRQIRVPLFAARPLNATGQYRVNISLR